MPSKNHALQFFRTFLRHPTKVGAVLPSSARLARELAGDLDLQAGDVVVEFGPGTGPITAVIAQQLRPDVDFVAIERDPGFHGRLRERFPSLDIHLGSAEDVAGILAERGLGAPRYILSGLPFASLPLPVQEGVIRGVSTVLRPDGEFRTFQYVHAYGLPAARKFRQAMQDRFLRQRRSSAVLRNAPPAYVLSYGEPRR